MRPGRLRARRRGQEWMPVALAAGGALIGCRLLGGTYALFQHAYAGSYWAVSGAQAGAVYWASVRFAFGETVLVALGVGVLASLVAFEAARAAGR